MRFVAAFCIGAWFASIGGWIMGVIGFVVVFGFMSIKS